MTTQTETRAARMDEVRRDATSSGRSVLGEGNLEARLMIVGEAPGKVEERLGRPFVGPAGQLLNRFFNQLGIPREQVWLTNVVKFRPVAAGRRDQINRPPKSSEIAEDRALLNCEIDIIRPRVILCLGATAASVLIHPNFRITIERGHWFPGPFHSKIIASYHPAYLLRLEGTDYERARDEMAADLMNAWAEAR